MQILCHTIPRATHMGERIMTGVADSNCDQEDEKDNVMPGHHVSRFARATFRRSPRTRHKILILWLLCNKEVLGTSISVE